MPEEYRDLIEVKSEVYRFDVPNVYDADAFFDELVHSVYDLAAPESFVVDEKRHLIIYRETGDELWAVFDSKQHMCQLRVSKRFFHVVESFANRITRSGVILTLDCETPLVFGYMVGSLHQFHYLRFDVRRSKDVMVIMEKYPKPFCVIVASDLSLIIRADFDGYDMDKVSSFVRLIRLPATEVCNSSRWLDPKLYRDAVP